MDYSVIIPLNTYQTKWVEQVRFWDGTLCSLTDKSSYEMIVVVGSSNNNVQLCKRLINQYPQLVVIILNNNVSLRQLIKTGSKIAKGQILALSIGDIIKNQKILPQLLKKIASGYEIACYHEPIKQQGIILCVYQVIPVLCSINIYNWMLPHLARINGSSVFSHNALMTSKTKMRSYIFNKTFELVSRLHYLIYYHALKLGIIGGMTLFIIASITHSKSLGLMSALIFTAGLVSKLIIDILKKRDLKKSKACRIDCIIGTHYST